jgi:hypothetical protein
MSATTTMSVLEWQARQAEAVAGAVSHWVMTTDQTKLDWTPELNGNRCCRSVYDQIEECAGVLNGIAKLVRGQEWPPEEEKEKADYKSGEEACEALKAAAANYAAAMRSADESVLDGTFKMPWGEAPASFMISLAVANMNYHGGQINAIQMMLGDQEFHFQRR